jgi:hypothetical protein
MRYALPLFLLSLGSAFGQQSVPFPMDPLGPASIPGTEEFQPDPAELDALTELNDIVLAGFPLPGLGSVDLGLERIEVDPADYGLQVDGVATPLVTLDQTLWKGRVAGDLFSEVQLTFASHGCYGWIRTGGETFHVIPFLLDGLDWDQSSVRIVPDAVMRATAAPRGQFCMADSTRRIGQPGGGAGQSLQGQLLELKIAVETDYQFYQQWGNLTAATNYLTALLAAISDRYTTEIDVVVTYPYVQLYTNSNDPWTSQSGGPGATLGEFRNAWAGNIPGGAHLAHFISGVNGGGVAYLDVLCNQNWGFGVSFGVDGGLSFPVQQGGNTWDFVVISHEVGHNVGTPHTHDFCPPVDQCAPSGYFGQCQNTQSCTNQGTIMSYCHLCGGGMNNITTYFHPTVKNLMRTEAVNSCIPPCNGCGGGSGCTDDSQEPNDNCGEAVTLTGGQTLTGMVVDGDNSDWWLINVPDGSTVTVDVTFLHNDGDIDARMYSYCFTLEDSSTSNSNNEQVSWTNNTGQTVPVYVETSLDGGQGCTDYDLAVDVSVDACSLPDDSYEPNDSCAAAGALGDGLYSGLWASKSDPDHYLLCVGAGSTVFVDAFFSHATANMNLYLYDVAGCGGIPIAAGASSTDNESLSWTNTSGAAMEVIVRAEVAASSVGDCNAYDMIVFGSGSGCGGGSGSGPIGTTYCSPATTNSSGVPGHIEAVGSLSIADNDLTLQASGLPTSQFGLFVTSATQASIPVSSGILCVGGSIGRFSGPGQIKNSGASGSFDLVVDLTANWPVVGVINIAPGETWNFSTWFRDVGSTSNFTDGISITFQ